MSTSSSKYNRFNINSGKIAASGNIMFLMDKTGELRDLSGKSYCYINMFFNCTSLTQAPALPATTLDYNCYECMFYNCTSLTQAPALPATNLAEYCYSEIFSYCTSLTQAPVLPATTLASYCYYSMFYNCTSLTQAPTLPATTLANYCYEYMFNYCFSLTQAPALPATKLAYSCYKNMFNGCTNISEPKYNMSIMTFDEVASNIQNNYIFGEFGYKQIEVQCSDKILVATFDSNAYQWTITEK